MKGQFSDTGIVVKVTDSGEADKYITIVTENHGLGHFIARGVRRLTSKKAPHLDLFNLIKFAVGRGENPLFLNQAETISFYPHIKSDYKKIVLALTIFEIITNTLPVDVEDREIFLSLKIFLEELDKASDKDINQLGRRFGLYLLRHLGYPPPKSPDSDNLSVYFETIMNRKIISKDIK